MPCVHLTKPVLKKKTSKYSASERGQALIADSTIQVRAKRPTNTVSRVRGAVDKHVGPLARASRQASKRQIVKTTAKVRQTVAAVREAPISTAQVKATRPTRADLINAESRLGSKIFGPVPAGHRREFFHDRQNIWIWHEDWSDQAGHARQLTIRYEVRPSGVFKKLAAGKYFKLEGEELENFRRATHAYLRVIKQHLYRQA